jgi:methylated-DNA-[protein]-cysteine S-methyltransferase
MTWLVIPSPIGDLRLHAGPDALTRIEFSPFPAVPDAEGPETGPAPAHPVLARAATQLREYFAGTRTEFSLPLAATGTEFQHRVWDELVRIGYGRTASYGEVAARLGLPPGASRAVGLANGRNPIPIVVPCHRVIGADGTLTGYAGGLDRKRLLLELENPTLV